MRTCARGLATGAALLAMLAPAAHAEEATASDPSASTAPAVAAARPASLVVPASAVVYTTGALGGRTGGAGKGRKGPLPELAISGLIVLGSGYVGTVLGGQIAAAFFGPVELEVGGKTTVDKLWVPIFGPFDAYSYNDSTVRPACEVRFDCTPGLVDGANIGILIGGAAQVTGVVLFVVGLATGGGGGDGPSTPKNRVIMTSSTLPGGGMLHVAGSF